MPLSIKERFKPNEMPSIWGSPAKPNLPSSLRLLYGVAFAIILITASLQNNLIIAYIDYLQGDFGFTPPAGRVRERGVLYGQCLDDNPALSLPSALWAQSLFYLYLCGAPALADSRA